MVADDPRRQRIAGTELTKLDQQALAQIARTHAGRVELLDFGEHGLDGRRFDRGELGQLFDARAEVAVVVGVADDQRGETFLLARKRRKAQLPLEMAEQILRLGEDVLERGPAVVVAGGIVRVARALKLVAVGLEILAPVDLLQVLGVLLDLRRFSDRLGLAHHTVHRRLGGIELERALLRLAFLEHRVLLELVLDQRLELGARHLQDLDRLAQLGRHHQLLGKLLEELRLESHRQSLYREKGSTIAGIFRRDKSRGLSCSRRSARDFLPRESHRRSGYTLDRKFPRSPARCDR